MTARIITVAQQKGGAGKTTLAAHLAVAFTAQKKSVAMVDIDPQLSLTKWYRLREARFGDAGAGLLVSAIKGWRVQNEVRRLAPEHDVVIVDSAPHAETETIFAVRNANLVIVPVQPSPMDVWATHPTVALAVRNKVPVLVVLNRVPPRANLTEEMVRELKSIHAGIAKTTIGNRIAFASALAEGRAVSEMQPRSRATQEIKALAKEVWRRA